MWELPCKRTRMAWVLFERETFKFLSSPTCQILKIDFNREVHGSMPIAGITIDTSWGKLPCTELKQTTTFQAVVIAAPVAKKDCIPDTDKAGGSLHCRETWAVARGTRYLICFTKCVTDNLGPLPKKTQHSCTCETRTTQWARTSLDRDRV